MGISEGTETRESAFVELTMMCDLEGLVVPPPHRSKREEHHQVESEVGDPSVDLSRSRERDQYLEDESRGERTETTHVDATLHLLSKRPISSESDHVSGDVDCDDEPEKSTHPSVQPVDRWKGGRESRCQHDGERKGEEARSSENSPAYPCCRIWLEDEGVSKEPKLSNWRRDSPFPIRST